MRTDAEIDAEIEKLRLMKPKMRRYSAFGDDHHAAIDAAIDVLTKGMDYDEVDAMYEDAEPNVYEVAGLACDWMQGQVDEAVSAFGWQMEAA